MKDDRYDAYGKVPWKGWDKDAVVWKYFYDLPAYVSKADKCNLPP